MYSSKIQTHLVAYPSLPNPTFSLVRDSVDSHSHQDHCLWLQGHSFASTMENSCYPSLQPRLFLLLKDP
ncbi:hypothetical protein HRI_004204500 [Hibiscus trionum]|uniref:Uncharacterized protein n=1 Tax=Hibiscus trionum TaxID=183268 RepID=A0A9W7J2S3_HIBTR|nr:hypothetical protein HRI_004204500 [Hibiscus trionum]